MFTTHSDLPQEEAISRLRFVNRLLGITPRRTAIDDALARLAALTFAENARKGMLVNIGVGLPEEACRMLFEAGLLQEVTVFTESGVIGGLPAPGIFFGAAACPKKMVRSAEAFHMCARQLDVTLLGVLEADSEGNVNVSKRGKTVKSYVGPGGFIDITTGARMIIFVTSWMAHADIRIEGGRIKIVKPGEPKFVDKVSEITFSGKQALKAGKKVFYVTTVGVFQLTERGVELIRVMPGIDIQKDILAASPMKIVLPPSGDVPVVDSGVVTGAGYQVSLSAERRRNPGPANLAECSDRLRRARSVGKQEPQVLQGEALGKLLLAQHVGHQRALLLLERADLLLDALAHQQAVGHHVAGLADAVRAVNGLVFHRRIPPRIEQHHVGRGGEVEPEAAGLEGNQEHGAALGGLKVLHEVAAILGAAGEIEVRPLALLHGLAQPVEHGDELREDEHLVAFLHERFEQVEQGVDFGAFDLAQLIVHQRGVAANLPQAEQRGEDVETLLVELLAGLDPEQQPLGALQLGAVEL